MTPTESKDDADGYWQCGFCRYITADTQFRLARFDVPYCPNCRNNDINHFRWVETLKEADHRPILLMNNRRVVRDGVEYRK